VSLATFLSGFEINALECRRESHLLNSATMFDLFCLWFGAALPGSFSSTTIRSMDWRFPLPFALCKLLVCKNSIQSPWQNGVAER
jgi:hypothetical protein